MKAVGDFDFTRKTATTDADSVEAEIPEEKMTEFAKVNDLKAESSQKDGINPEATDITSYRPNVQDREWIISETDVSWISIGCYILGTGGGGSPYSHTLHLREIMRAGGVVRVKSPDDLLDDDLVACGGGKGSPTVGHEKLTGTEYVQHVHFKSTLSLTIIQNVRCSKRTVRLHESLPHSRYSS